MNKPSQPDLDLGKIGEPSAPNPDKKAQKEEESLLKNIAWKTAMDATAHWWKRTLLAISFIIIIVFILIRVFMLVTPYGWHWLTEPQTSKIDEFFVHGTIGAIIASYLGKHFKSEERH